MSKWRTVWLVNLHDIQNDSYSSMKTIKDAAKVYCKHYQIPRGARFTNRPDEYSYFTPLATNALLDVTREDKLLLVGHGLSQAGNVPNYAFGPFHEQEFTPLSLTLRLRHWGLMEVGLISFKACHLGHDLFLDQFVTECTNQRIDVGWAKGYRGAATTNTSLFGKPHEQIAHTSTPFGHKKGAKRYKIVKGPLAWNKGGRYLEEDDD